MGRIAFGEDKVMQKVLDMAKDGYISGDPLDKLKMASGLHGATLKRYLDTLVEKGFIRIEYRDRRGGIDRIIVLKNEIPEVTRPAATPTAKPKPPPPPPPSPPPVATPTPEPTPAPKPTPAPETQTPLVVVLVDYDNARGTAQDNGFGISFARLKELTRQYGRILFADVFLSPASNKPDTVAKLWDAGFMVVACPMEFKDQDAVDHKMFLRAMAYLERTPVNIVVVVSRDRDFQGLADQAADMGKSAIFLDILTEQEKLEGADIVPEIFPKKLTENFERTLNCLIGGQPDTRPGGAERTKFIEDVILVIVIQQEENADPDRRYAFKTLEDIIRRSLRDRYTIPFLNHYLQAAMTALVNGSVLSQSVRTGYAGERTCYILNREHPVVLGTLSIETLLDDLDDLGILDTNVPTNVPS